MGLAPQILFLSFGGGLLIILKLPLSLVWVLKSFLPGALEELHLCHLSVACVEAITILPFSSFVYLLPHTSCPPLLGLPPRSVLPTATETSHSVSQLSAHSPTSPPHTAFENRTRRVSFSCWYPQCSAPEMFFGWMSGRMQECHRVLHSGSLLLGFCQSPRYDNHHGFLFSIGMLMVSFYTRTNIQSQFSFFFFF